MNKNAIKKFAIDARNKLIASVTDKAGMLGISADGISEAITKGMDFEVYKTSAGTEVTLNRSQSEQRRRLAAQIESRGFEAVIEEVAYTWFNRICAIRFMEVNDYIPVRVLSSIKEGKTEPDIVTSAPDVDFELTDEEKSFIVEAKIGNKLDELFRMLFIKQCHELNDILPELFEKTEDYTEMLLNISYTNEDDVIRMLIDNVDEQDFNVTTVGEDGNPTGQVEIIGWLYQYYNTELKDDTFSKLKKNVKITKERIPAATQLFTPDWIVRYMVENSVGRIWIEHLRAVDPSIDEKTTAENFGWRYYLPEAEQEESVNVKLAEVRTSYAELKPEDITCIDPCMGSGHILIAMFDVLMDIYKSTGYSEREAAFTIVENNIHGLDIDKRAYQLAYFAVMMKGRGYNRRFFRGHDDIKPQPRVKAIQESNGINRTHIKYFGADLNDIEKNNAINQINGLLDEMLDAREYGSLLDVDNYDWDLLRRFVNKSGEDTQISIETIGIDNTKEQLCELISVGYILSQKYKAVITNPPYMGCRKGMNPTLKKYVEKNYQDSKSDLYTCFIEKCCRFRAYDGLTAMITMHSFMFTDDYKELRTKIINNDVFVNMAHLGSDAFPEINGEVVQTAAFILANNSIKPSGYFGCYARLLDYPCDEKPKQFMAKSSLYFCSMNQYENVKATPFSYWLSKQMRESFNRGKSFEDCGKPRQGMATGDNDTFLRLWFEVDVNDISFSSESVEDFHESLLKYVPYNKGGEKVKWYGNRDYVIKFDTANYNILLNQGNHLPSRQYYMLPCVTWSDISGRSFAARYCPQGSVFDVKGSCAFPQKEDFWLSLAFLNCKLTPLYIDSLNPTTTTQVGDLKRIPILNIEKDNLELIEKYAKECVEICKADWDTKETSWDFTKNPLIGRSTIIEEAFVMFANECRQRRERLIELETKINQLFIDSYGLNSEVNSEVDEKEVKIKIPSEEECVKDLISYAIGCMFGRYSLGTDGIVKELNDKHDTGFGPVSENVILITDEEYFKNDVVELLSKWVEVAFGQESYEANMAYIASKLKAKGKTAKEILRNYMVNEFYKDHCNLYSIKGSGKRPIYWQFSSGDEHGMQCLVYIHRYTEDNVGLIRAEYLHKTQVAIEQAMKTAETIRNNTQSNVDKSEATKKIAKYAKQLAELLQYDEAVAVVANKRVKLDVNEGVLSNYQKFQNIEIAHEGKKSIKINLLTEL